MAGKALVESAYFAVEQERPGVEVELAAGSEALSSMPVTAEPDHEPLHPPEVLLKNPRPNRPLRDRTGADSPGQAARLPAAASARYSGPDYQRNPPPAYPKIARQNGWQGLVLLEVLVNTRGLVESVRVRKSTGYRILDRAALEAVRSWRFRPARAAGLPIASTVEVPVQFVLE